MLFKVVRNLYVGLNNIKLPKLTKKERKHVVLASKYFIYIREDEKDNYFFLHVIYKVISISD